MTGALLMMSDGCCEAVIDSVTDVTRGSLRYCKAGATLGESKSKLRRCSPWQKNEFNHLETQCVSYQRLS